jgi:hypothetical protein
MKQLVKVIESFPRTNQNYLTSVLNFGRLRSAGTITLARCFNGVFVTGCDSFGTLSVRTEKYKTGQLADRM